MSSYCRTHTCGALSAKNIGEKILLAGWVHRHRDHGGVIFIDLRDRFGLTQIIFRPEVDTALHEMANQLRAEWVVAIEGEVIARADGMINAKLATGEIEITVSKMTILSEAQTPPFSICDEHINVNEELRLKYRYLDIRRGEITKRLIKRHEIMQITRNFLSDERFIEVTTPLLGKSTPEGARDYLVPSRMNPGSFYALPQSPQIFKQILMISGMDRYFQIATCMRDEDLRADRQPEFGQIDLEMSFGTQEELFELMEQLMVTLFEKCLGKKLETPFQQIAFAESMERYGTDKPDLRFGMELVRLDDLAEQSSFTVMKEQVAKGGCVKGICVKGGAKLSRRQIDEYTSYVGKFGAQGLAWIKMQEEGPASSIVKFFSEEVMRGIVARMNAQTGDLMLFVAAPEKTTHQALDHLRRHIAHELKLIDDSSYRFAWITEFPLFQWDTETQNYACEHHPFTAPYAEDTHLLDTDPLKARSSSYDLVLNGYELGSGSERIYESDLQEKIFNLLKLSNESIKNRFGFLIEALKYGTPPHRGIALGIDRIVMLMTGATNLREVIAFPKTQRGTDLMSDAPSEVLKEQLTELKIHVELPDDE